MGNLDWYRLSVLDGSHGEAVSRAWESLDTEIGRPGDEQVIERGPWAKDGEKQPWAGADERLGPVAQDARPALLVLNEGIH
jgi:hypothetical protein